MEINFKPTIKQFQAFEYLNDKTTTELLFGGGAGGCFESSTLVSTIKGFKEISKIKKGDLVLSYDKKAKILKYNKVLRVFMNGGWGLCVNLKINNKYIYVTETHKFLFNGKWIEIGKLIWRMLEKNRQNWKILDKQQREIKNKELEKFWKDCNNESLQIKQRLSENNYCFRKKECQCKYPQISSRSIYSEQKEQTTNKSQGFKQKEQLCGKSGMGNSKREFSPCKKIKPYAIFYGKCREQRESKSNERGIKSNKQIKRNKSERNKKEIQTKKIYQKNVSKRIQCKRSHNKRCHSKKELEACEIDLNKIQEIIFYKQKEIMYDLEIEYSESYAITKDKIIVHNSKSYGLCAWLIISSLKYPGSRWAMCRAKLKTLKQTTLLTFFDICRSWGLKRDVHFKYITDEKIVWNNTTEIYLKDLFLYPSDPEFDALGSTEYTGAAIDELSEVTLKSKNILMSRLRYKLDEFGIVPKLFMASNPAKNFLYTDFYKPFKNGTLPIFRKFIPALVTDNPYISHHYIENLKKLDEVSKQRLLYGNWEYDDDPTKLMDYDSIVDLWTNHVEVKGEKKYISCDVARMGIDKTVIMYWEGLRLVKIWSYPLTKVNETIELIEEIRKSYGVQRSHIIVDEDGVGGGVVDIMGNVKGFVNNSKAIENKYEKNPKNYSNLKTQCYYFLADKVNRGEIQIKDNDTTIKELLIQDLEQVKQKDPDKDEQRIRLVSKDTIKENIGRSPDYSDAMMMRMYFELKSSKISFGFV